MGVIVGLFFVGLSVWLLVGVLYILWSLLISYFFDVDLKECLTCCVVSAILYEEGGDRDAD